ncbi:glycosyltransferase [Aequorivita sp. H23M31]|uniref:Glycosyltransferase n=1 Tax=Aequorivita ciconiae TaxID=2494375 RepID=A0A410G0Y1_9FLAO|nr:glycosyltransferase [Aequorivita sp. H23M31]QAA80911.1 glycosyltransferase [Aequorivita sp. H23M31]
MNSLLNISTEESELLEFIDGISQELETILPPPDGLFKMVVIIPAKDEANQIEDTLLSLAHQVDSDNNPIQKHYFEVLVLCHNCSDNTFGIVEQFFKEHPQLSGHVLRLDSEKANTVGAARRVLMNIAYHRLTSEKGLIISTDADTVPHPHWLYHLNGYVDKNFDFICGRIVPNYENLNPQALKFLLAKDEYLDLRSELGALIFPNPDDPWPKHEYNWGPNIAIKKKAYGAIGGIRPMHFLEDVDLYNRAVGQGYKARHCNNTIVTTSTRIDSRCSEGFGAELKDWAHIPGVSYYVEGLEKLLIRYSIYNLIKRLFLSYSENIISEIIRLSHIKKEELERFYNIPLNYESWVIAMDEHLKNNIEWHSEYRNISVFNACREIREYIDSQKKEVSTLSSPKA